MSSAAAETRPGRVRKAEDAAHEVIRRVRVAGAGVEAGEVADDVVEGEAGDGVEEGDVDADGVGGGSGRPSSAGWRYPSNQRLKHES